jgi:hypothetical protein
MTYNSLENTIYDGNSKSKFNSSYDSLPNIIACKLSDRANYDTIFDQFTNLPSASNYHYFSSRSDTSSSYSQYGGNGAAGCCEKGCLPILLIGSGILSISDRLFPDAHITIADDVGKVMFAVFLFTAIVQYSSKK